MLPAAAIWGVQRVLPTLVAVSWAAFASMPGYGLAASPRTGGLSCGVIREPADWNKDDSHGDLSPLAAEICRALAIADAAPGKAEPLHTVGFKIEDEALAALQRGTIDVAVGVTPNDATAERYGVMFGPTIFEDGLFLATGQRSGVLQSRYTEGEFDGNTVCYLDGTPAADAALATLRRPASRPIPPHRSFIPFPFQEQGEMDAAVIDGRCAVVAETASRLGELRAQFGTAVGTLRVLQPPLAVIPAVIATRKNDRRWSDTAIWTLQTLLEAEVRSTGRPRQSGPASWDRRAANLLETTGNFGDMFRRTLGDDTPRRTQRIVEQPALPGGSTLP